MKEEIKVDETKKQQLALEKKQFSLKIMYLNRYLVIRYLTAFFFFINLSAAALIKCVLQNLIYTFHSHYKRTI